MERLVVGRRDVDEVMERLVVDAEMLTSYGKAGC